MPTIQCDQDVLNNLCDQVSPSVVIVNTYETTSYDLDFATGFVI
uniref:Uncharacterized protein n=1 Tax=Arundo donax TaxID=35708 RepID=A0A0A9CJV8_ARUDO